VRSGGSRELARDIRAGRATTDVFLSADAQVIEAELMGPVAAAVSWHLTFAANSLVLTWSGRSRAAAAAARVRDGTLPLVDLLEEGFRLGRPDPESDPKGYRTLFVVQLLEQHVRRAGLAARVLGEPRNQQQIFPPDELVPRLRGGDLDLVLSYRSQAVAEGLPFLKLPPETDLGSPEHADTYAGVDYRCEDGTVYRGAPVAYAAAIPGLAPNPLGAAAFLAFLTTPTARRLLEEQGFRPLSRLATLHEGRLSAL
jgi:molybdate/tungstate transport system substrate-binding protein